MPSVGEKLLIHDMHARSADLVFQRLKKIYGLLTKCEVKMAGCWPSSFFACLCVNCVYV